MNGWVNRQNNGPMTGWTIGGTIGRSNGPADKRTDGQMDGRTNGRTNGQVLVSYIGPQLDDYLRCNTESDKQQRGPKCALYYRGVSETWKVIIWKFDIRQKSMLGPNYQVLFQLSNPPAMVSKSTMKAVLMTRLVKIRLKTRPKKVLKNDYIQDQDQNMDGKDYLAYDQDLK